jgi:acetyltransferase
VSTYRLDRLFRPRSLAIVGASDREGSLGRAVLENVTRGGFAGPVGIVNPKRRSVGGRPAARALGALGFAPDLVVVATPAAAVPGVLREAGEAGAAAVVVLTAGLGRGEGSLGEAARLEARRRGLRLVGPNCFGVIAPPARLDASFAARGVAAGDLAVVSQSGAVMAGLIEWAARRKIGFSALASLGDMLDVDFGDCLDFFAADPGTRAILLYVEAITDARKFMSAARAAARVKPVVVIKSGRHAQGARAAATHTGALAGSDAVYEAAFRRAGLLRVFDLDELFAAVETLSRQAPFPGKRVAVVTNGGGVGVLAVDRLVDLGAELAVLAPETVAALDAALPPTWSRANPVDVIGDADPARYAAATAAVLADPNADAVLVVNVPTALSPAAGAAEAVAAAVRAARAAGGRKKPVFAVWLGEDEASRAAFEGVGAPLFSTEADAVRGLTHLMRYREAQDLLMETPDSLPHDFAPDVEAARAVVAGVIAEGRSWLGPLEVDRLLAAYAIPAAPVRLATSPEEAAEAARAILAEGSPVAVKIMSPDIVHKSDVGGVSLDLTSPDAVRRAAEDILERARRLKPGARLTGVTVQAMVRRPKARELICGLADDPTFGPVVVFGRGGTAVEVIADTALALPPLDMTLAEMLIARTRVSRILKAYRDVPAADERVIRLVLVKLAQLAADIPEVRELDVNPLLADERGVIAVDARVRVAAEAGRARGKGHPRFAVRPYPKEWERRFALRTGQEIFVRPIRPEDEGLVLRFLAKVTPEDLRLRFFAPVRSFTHAFLARLVQIDYARAIAFIALDVAGEMLGVVRLHADVNHEKGEYAVLVRSDLKGLGLGSELMGVMLEWAKADGLRVVEGQVLAENTVMLDMCRALGFEIRTDPEDPNMREVRLRLP